MAEVTFKDIMLSLKDRERCTIREAQTLPTLEIMAVFATNDRMKELMRNADYHYVAYMKLFSEIMKTIKPSDI